MIYICTDAFVSRGLFLLEHLMLSGDFLAGAFLHIGLLLVSLDIFAAVEFRVNIGGTVCCCDAKICVQRRKE